MKENIVSILNIINQSVKERLQHSHDRYIQQQQLQVNDCLYCMADQMIIELYEAFHAHDYHLAPLLTAQSIRFNGYRYISGNYIFLFSMDKKTDNKIIDYVLSEIRNKMNHDIASTQRKLAYMYDNQTLYCTYPFLYHGICITAIQDLKISEVLITVQTNLTPQKFQKIYRQIF